MTLIAGFRAQGLPILLGDLLLTTTGRPSGLAKKLRRLRSNIVLAWTGHSLAAEFVVGVLDRQLPPGRITYQLLQRVLTGLDVSSLGILQVVLIGWIADEGEHCFRWRSDYSEEVFDVEAAFEGAGGSLVEAIVQPSKQASVPRDPVKIEGALLEALCVATRLMSYEAADPSNAAGRTFGHAYELLYLQGDSFSYVDRILYATVLIGFGEGDAVASAAFAGPVFRYRSRHEVAVVDLLDQHERRLYLTTAIADPSSHRRVRSLRTEYEAALRLKRYALSQYRCLFVQMVSDTYIAMPGALTQGPSTPDDQKWLLEDSVGRLSLRFPEKLVSDFYRLLKHYEQTGQILDPGTLSPG